MGRVVMEIVVDKDIIEYCKLNGVEDLETFVLGLINKGFIIEKWGDKPPIVTNRETVKDDNTKLYLTDKTKTNKNIGDKDDIYKYD